MKAGADAVAVVPLFEAFREYEALGCIDGADAEVAFLAGFSEGLGLAMAHPEYARAIRMMLEKAWRATDAGEGEEPCDHFTPILLRHMPVEVRS